MAEYLDRKRAEIAFWRSQLREPGAPGRVDTVEEVLAAKLALRTRQMSEAVQDQERVTESNWTGEERLPFHDYTLKYRYQRFDLSIAGPAIYPCLRRDRAPDGLVSGSGYAGSGMAAIAGVLLALQRVCPGAVLVAADDSYFETQCLVRHHLPALALAPAGPETSLPQALAAAGSAPMVALLVDSICHRDPTIGLDEIEAPPDLLLLDSSCYEVGDPRIARVAAQAMAWRVPLVIVRSHVKLDCFGVEYGRLGSVVFVRPPGLSPARADQLSALLAAHRGASAWFGLKPNPAHLLPFAADDQFQQLNRARLRRVEENNAAATVWIGGGVGSVRAYHHGKYVTVEPPATTRVEILDGLGRFEQQAARVGVPARRADSFGFDFIAMTDWLDLRSQRPALRVAISDVPEAVLERFATLWRPFMQQAFATRETDGYGAHSAAR